MFTLMIVRFAYLLIVSDLQKMSHPVDYRAESCGLNHLSQRPYLYYILPNIDLNVKMCVSKCPIDTNRDICLYRRNGISLHSE